MGKDIFLQSHLWCKVQNYLLKSMTSISVKPMILLSVTKIFSLLQTARTFSSEKSIQTVDFRITQLLVTHYNRSRQYNLEHFSLGRVQNCTQATCEYDCARTFASVFIPPKTITIAAFRYCSTSRETRVFCAQSAPDKR